MKTRLGVGGGGKGAACLLLLAFALLGASVYAPRGAFADGRVKIGSAADLPVHTYAVTSEVRPLAEDPKVVSALAAAVSADITADLARYDIVDRATLRGLYSTLLDAAFLRKDFAAARRDIKAVQGLEDKPGDRATSGLLGRALLDALQSPGTDFHQALRADIKRAYRAVPYGLARDNLKQQSQTLEVLSRDVLVAAYASEADAAMGHISQGQADGLLDEAFVLQYIVPNKADLTAAYSAVLGAGRDVPKVDIWAARDVTLAPSARLTPVIVGVWDSGVDVSLYRSQLVSGSPGMAYDAQEQPTSDLLYPLPGGAAAATAGLAEMKGDSDFQEGVGSPEAAAFKAKVAGMTSEQMRGFDERLGLYERYVHGTHVAGIALRGNPAARLLVCNMNMKWDGAPTAAQAGRAAAMFRRSVAYFKARGARVVNLSWGIRLSDIDTTLETDGAGGTPAERRALARKIYDIGFQGILEAIRSAPGILFVAAAGNDDEDVLFNGSYPASVKAPNLLVVGAVDKGGEETSFTSFGNVDVYADGVDVPSLVPGGAILELSGTSMAAPQVTNLAAKLLAARPALTVAQVKAAILGGADRKTTGGRTILLINPRQTLHVGEVRR